MFLKLDKGLIEFFLSKGNAGHVECDCSMHTLTLLNASLFDCNIAILPLDFVRLHGQSCAYIYTHSQVYVHFGQFLTFAWCWYSQICAKARSINEAPRARAIGDNITCSTAYIVSL